MNKTIAITPDAKQPHDISNCRVRRVGAGMEICMVNAQCIYDLPYGNLCAHPLASQMAEAWEYMPHPVE